MAGNGWTPGRWVATERSGYHEILAPCADSDWYGRENTHAVAYVDTEVDNQAAHAHLVAAAPDLFEALEGLLKSHCDAADMGPGLHGADNESEVIAAKTALARARGEEA